MSTSDDFASGTLDPVWTVAGPAGAAASLGSDATDAFLELVSPDGGNDAWGTNNASRLMQATADTDFQLEARFLSVPTQKFQLQGFLVEQDPDNWIRFDTYSNGSKLYAFAAVTLDGSTTAKFSVQIPEGSAPYLRLTRTGDQWTMEYSQDGQAWTVAGSFTQALTVTSAGLMAGNSGAAAGFTAQVDYFENSADPIADEDGAFTPVNQAPEAADDTLVTPTDTALVIDVANDLLGNDSDPETDPLTPAGMTQPANGTLVDNGDGTWSYTPNAGFEGTDSFTYTISDGELTDTATVNVTVSQDPPPPPGTLVSDDFASGTLDPVWTVAGPAGAAASLGSDATDAFLELVSPDGGNDAWGTNNASRLMQATADTDFQLEARFLSVPTQKFQLQGFLVEQDPDNWIRFDTYSNGSKLYAFAAVTLDGSTTAKFSVQIPEGSAPYLRLTRTGDQWTMEYSQDGQAWTVAGSFTQALTVTSAGLMAGNSGAAAGFTAQVDYFENSADPIADEDGAFTPVNQAPEAADDTLVTPTDTALVIDVANDLLGNDSDPETDPLTPAGMTQPANGTLVDNGDGTWSYTPNAGFEGTDSFTYTISDGELTDTATVNVTVSQDPPPPPGTLVSDDFASGTLDPVWTVAGPAGAAASLGSDATDAFLELVSPDGGNDAWGTNNASRLMQATADTDFQLEARFLSVPTQKFQLQGFLVEQDPDNWIRFDTYSNGSKLYAFAAVTLDGSTTAKFSVQIPEGSAPYLRLTRTGDQWTMEYSQDGQAWTVAGSFTQALTVTSAGLMAGNSGAAAGFTAQVDYFENSADPIADEDGAFTPVNQAPEAADDTLVTPTDTALVIDVANDLLGNDSDPETDPLTPAGMTQPANGTLVDNGDGTWSYTPNAGFEGTDSFTYTISDGELTDTATVNVTVRDAIDIWYGPEQSFGSPGEGQTAINILGNVAGEITSLTYSLNGGPAQSLSLGPDTRRLQNPGDFNVEIDYADLDGSSADDVITITATYSNGTVYSRDVIVDYKSGHTWDPNYSIDWETVTDIQDVVQITDGTWQVTADGARPIDLGYDRLLVLGDSNWDNYEVNLTVTMHDLENEDPRGRDGGAFVFGMLWGGHTGSGQPSNGYEPGAAISYSHSFKASSYHEFSELVGYSAYSLEEGLTYNFSVRVEQVGLYDRLYSLKVWEVGEAEPVDWTVQGLETFSIEEAPATGSFYLNAHYYDVTFGDISVTEITGDDIVNGDESNETLVAVDTATGSPGQGEIDVFVGAGGTDVFVFGDENGSYYDDGVGAETGDEDYGFIWDFTSGTDAIQLAGSASDYTIVVDASGLPSGSAIYRLGQSGAVDELVGIVSDVYGLDLNSVDFTYTETLLT